MVDGREQRVGVRRQVDPHDLRLLVRHVVDEAGVLVGEPVVVLAPDVARQDVVQRRDRTPPRDAAGHLQPLGVLVDHRVDDVDERLVAVEHPVPPGEQVALQPALAQVLRQHLHHPAVRGEVVVPGDGLGVPGAVGRLEQRRQPVGRGLVGTHDPERAGVGAHHVAQVLPRHVGRRTGPGARVRDVDGVVAELRQQQVLQQRSAVGARVRAHPTVAGRCQRGQVRAERTVGGEQLLRLVAAHPLLELRTVLGVGADLRQRHLVRPPGALDLQPVDDRRAGPALGRAQHDHRPDRTPDLGPGAGAGLDRGDVVERVVHRRGQRAVHQHRVVAGHEDRAVPVALHQRDELGLRDPRENGRVGDLVAVEVQDRQHHAVAGRVEELVGVPARRERPGLGLAVADHAGHHEVGVVERGSVGVHQRISQFAALVDRAGCLRRHVAGDPAGERELPEQPAQAVDVAADLRDTPRCRCPPDRRWPRSPARRGPARSRTSRRGRGRRSPG